MLNKWMLRQTSANINELARATGLNCAVAQILAVRGYRDFTDINTFIDADKLPLHSPFLFKDMEKAVCLTYEAIKTDKKIAVFGDYDADGILSTVILCKTIAALGGQVVFYIPSREAEGYGLNKEAVTTLKDSGVDLIITCDNGISAFEEIEYANSFGIGTIILDHHEVQKAGKNGAGSADLLPAALAIVDAKQADCSYPFRDYCAAALCYRFSEALYTHTGQDWRELAEELLPFVAIATICDMVELLGENRALVKRGISQIRDSQNIGLQLLLKYTGINNRTILPYHIGFILGPCINACGRLEMAAIAVELFLTKDSEQADKLASYLVDLNNSRKEITSQGYELAIAKVEEENLDQQPIIFLHCPSIQESVAGIIAGKLKDRYYKPSFVVAGDKDVLRGSCRSVEGYNVFQALSGAQDILNSFGGHPMAAGFAVKKDHIPQLAGRLIAAYPLMPEDTVKTFRIDKEISLCDVNISLARQLEKLQPFGKGNPVPTFADKSVKVSRINFIGKDAQIIKLYCQGKRAKLKNGFLEAVSFYGKDKLETLIRGKFGAAAWENMLEGRLPELLLDLIFSLSINEYEGREYLQLHLLDFRLSD